ncbi:phthalate dioxygenase reductase [Fusarium mexicanum]|uniref:Phthalate dioxygenase reductase n=1 Tax=Fusarium mexicanum TaxID=751941 RepID=A0A8H5IKI1_9HYPO|nr:phthalate dioxygenase reductase [Fusarium mexicanum]
MGVPSTINIPKETVSHLDTAPTPKHGVLLQVRAGRDGPVFCSATGVLSDEHAYSRRGGTERAFHQCNPDHYLDWRAENPPEPDLYDVGAYGENLVTTNMNDDNVCIGDIYKLGDDVLLEVSEPRHPCFKLNSQFKWPRVLKRTIRTGRAGCNMRVLKTGNICKGDTISLLERPYPEWSVLNVRRVLRARNVPLNLLAGCAQPHMTDLLLEIEKERLRSAPKIYTSNDGVWLHVISSAGHSNDTENIEMSNKELSRNI